MQILFLAEAKSGDDKSFYKCNTILFKTIKTAFEAVFYSFSSGEEFMNFFEATGCYLDHLCLSLFLKLTKQNG